MASGTFLLSKKNSSSSVTFQGKLEWTSTSNGSVANSSNVVVKLYARKQGSSTPTSGKGWNGYITIDGTKTTYSTSSSLSIQNSWVLVSQASKTVAHNNNGTKSITIAGAVTGPSGTTLGSITSSGSTTITLDTIPRYATSVQSLASKTETSISINWSSDNTIDYIWYSSNNGSSWTGLNVTDGKSGSYTISGLSANTTYQVKTRVRRKDNQLTTDSSALSVTTYAYPYANSMPNFTIGNTLTIGLYNPLGRSVEVIIIGADDTLCSYDVTTGTSITGYSGSSVVSSLYSTIPNAKSGTYKVSVAYGSQTSIKTGGTYTINTSACTPTIDSVSYKDTNASVTAITQNNQNIVRNQSIVQYNATGLHPKNSATISSCSVSVNGNTYNLSVSYSGGYIASGGNATIDSSDDVTATFTLTDSRGLTATKTINISMLDWVLPNAIITLQRQNNFYSETDINVDANYSSVDGKNEITLKVRYKKTTDTTYSSYVTLQDNVTSVLNLDNLYEWDVQVLVQDLFGSTTYNAVVQVGMPIIYFDRLKSSTGFNCFPKDEKSVEANGVNLERNVMTRALSSNVSDLAVNTYTIVPLDLTNVAGSKLTATEDGGIEIGANVSKILVSGRASIQGSSTTGRRHLRIMKNSYTNNNTIAWSQDDFAASVTEDIVITPTLGNVQEGDVIYLFYYVPNSADSIGGNTYGARTSLTVEVVE